jgi:biotin operon repressor
MTDLPRPVTYWNGAEVAKTLSILERATGPLTAIEIATRLGLEGCRESQRRHVRAIIEELRDKGVRIVADRKNGYFITRHDSVWRDYLDGRQIEGKGIIGEAHRRKKCMYEDGTIAMFGQQVATGIG